MAKALSRICLVIVIPPWARDAQPLLSTWALQEVFHAGLGNQDKFVRAVLPERLISR